MKFSLIDKAFFLKKSPMFAHLSIDMLMTIANQADTLKLESGDLIFEEGQPAHSFYLIASGQVGIQPSGQAGFTRGETDFFGDEALFNEQNRAYTARAETDLELLSISRSDLLTIIQESPAVAVALLHLYTSLLKVRP